MAANSIKTLIIAEQNIKQFIHYDRLPPFPLAQCSGSGQAAVSQPGTREEMF